MSSLCARAEHRSVKRIPLALGPIAPSCQKTVKPALGACSAGPLSAIVSARDQVCVIFAMKSDRSGG